MALLVEVLLFQGRLLLGLVELQEVPTVLLVQYDKGGLVTGFQAWQLETHLIVFYYIFNQWKIIKDYSYLCMSSHSLTIQLLNDKKLPINVMA